MTLENTGRIGHLRTRPLGHMPAHKPSGAVVGRGANIADAFAASSSRSGLHDLFAAGYQGSGKTLAGRAVHIASAKTAQGIAAGKHDRIPRRGHMQVGVFSDGTSNDKSDFDRYTNIAKLNEAYDANDRDIFAVYKRGVGTDRGLLGDIKGKAFGFGGMDRIEGVLFDVQKSLERYLDVNGTFPEKITMDLFGFSRGAAGARHFMNVIKQGAFTLDPPFDQIPKEAFKFRFVGLGDTVGSFYQPGDNEDGPYTFSVPKQWADRVVHLVADNEFRANFDLQSLFPDQGQVPADRTEGNYVEDVVMGAHADLFASYSSNQMEHGVDNNQLSRVYLQRFLTEASRAGAPFKPLAELLAKQPDHWRIDPQVQQAYDRIQGYYDRHPDLQPEHKKLREIERGMEYARHRLNNLTAQQFGDNEEMMDEATQRALENRIEQLSQAAGTQRRKLEGLLGGETPARRFLDIYGEFRNQYIHRSHAPVNRTPGMHPEVQEDGRLRRQVFHKPFRPLTEVMRPEKFND